MNKYKLTMANDDWYILENQRDFQGYLDQLFGYTLIEISESKQIAVQSIVSVEKI